MPIYEYQCDACGHQHEVLQKISDDLLTSCPECGKDALKKIISAAGFRLSGNGWYETDFKTGDKRNIAGDAEKKSATKSKETDKPAKKTEPKKPADSKAKSA